MTKAGHGDVRLYRWRDGKAYPRKEFLRLEREYWDEIENVRTLNSPHTEEVGRPPLHRPLVDSDE